MFEVLIVSALIIMTIFMVVGFAKAMKPTSTKTRYSKAKIMNGQRYVYDTFTHDWVLWSLVIDDVYSDEACEIESQFDRCVDEGSCSNELRDFDPYSISSSSPSFSSSEQSSSGYSGSDYSSGSSYSSSGSSSSYSSSDSGSSSFD